MNFRGVFSVRRFQNIIGSLIVCASGVSFAETNQQPYRLDTVVVTGVADAPASGSSATLLDGKLVASASGFWTDTHNYQVYRPVVTFDGQSSGLDFYILNAKEARTIGVELELRALPCKYFEFRLAAGYQNAEFRDFKTPPPFSQNLDGKTITSFRNSRSMRA